MTALDFPVVGLGASAGGLDAFRRFFEAAPADGGIAYILIQHLDPNHESMMAELLAGRTTMAVQQATDGMVVERNHVYIIAPGTYLAIENGALRLSEPRERHGARLPFDFFLRSLAEACGERAVAVILSGTGSDGSLGLRAIQEKGGLVIAQEPEEATFNGMPNSAIATGLVSLVLPVASIPKAILLRRDGPVADPATGDSKEPTAEPESPPSQLGSMIALIRDRTQHDFTLYKDGTLLRRIERRMMAAGITDWAGYLETLHGNSDEIELLAQTLLINVTHFFRDPQAFAMLAETVVAELVRTQPLDRPLRVWVPGCSTGEETYSLAMLFLEAIAASKRPLKLQVFASDVDTDAVAVARAGLYPETIEAEVASSRLARFFIREPAGYRVTPDLRGMVVFTVQDLLKDPPFSRLDLVSCRNLLIYLRPQAQRKVLLLFHFALREGGVLFLGGSETVGDLTDRFEAISKPDRLYRHIGRSRPGDVDFPIGNGPLAVWPRRPPRPDPPAPGPDELIRSLLLETYAPASVLVNRKHEVLYTVGRTDRYLRIAPGEPSRDLLVMVREGLRAKLRTALQRAWREQKRVVMTGAELGPDDGHDDKAVTVSVDVQPVRYNGEELLVISFIDEPEPESQPTPTTGNTANAVDAVDAARFTALEGELNFTRAELQAAIRDLEIANEEQKAINEEAMSVNEEFQSSNEELETSKEELQSLNEELTALNNQLQETVEQQRSTANDLQNILNSSDTATLFLDGRLNIRFFTPAAKSLFGVIATDIGRPLSDLARRFDDPDLLTDAQAVLTQLEEKKREVRADAGTWHLRRVLPYRTETGKIAGVVITFADISEIKAVEHDLEMARSYAEGVIDTIHQPLVVLDSSLCVVSANRAFYRVFGVSPGEAVKHYFTADGGPAAPFTGLRAYLKVVRTAATPVEDYEVEIELPRLGLRQLRINARNIRQRQPVEPLILLAVDDVTERAHADAAMKAAMRQAEQANIGKSRFLAAASHDLRQPLQTLNLLQGLLARKVAGQAVSELVHRFGETLGAMSGILNTLLDINQLEAGIVRTDVVNFPINDILERLGSEFGYHTQAHGLGWRVVGCRAVVRSDPHLLEQIIRNLLSNAVKYTLHGKVLLGCRRHGDNLRIGIWDTGSGIPESQRQAVFEEFTQLGNAARENSKGLGLGLSIVRRLADMLGHTVDVASVPDKGSMFSVEVPVVAFKAAARLSPPNRPAAVACPSTRKTILIVEDDQSVREALELLLNQEGYNTACVADGPLALEWVDQSAAQIHLIIADYNLPGPHNGVQLIERLRTTAELLCPVVILTGDISIGALQEISRQGCRHISKPVRPAELLRLIQDLLSNQPEPVALVPPDSKHRPAEVHPAHGLTIFVVDDDTALREAMRALLESDQRQVETFPSAESFLDAWSPDRDGCLVVDARLPGMSGIHLIERLAADGHALPAIVITGFGDVQMAVRAMKAGAVDFIEKPVRSDELLAGIDRAIVLSRDDTKLEAARKTASDLLSGLTERQHQIMDMVLAGHPSKNIAADLGISQRTVENHRAAIMKKTGAKSLPALARLALGLG